MRLDERLEPKLSEIRRRAMKRFTVTELSRFGLRLDEAGELEFDPRNPLFDRSGAGWSPHEMEQALASVQGAVSRFLGDLDALLARFRSYYAPFHDVVGEPAHEVADLCVRRLGEPHAGPDSVYFAEGIIEATWQALNSIDARRKSASDGGSRSH